MKVSTAVSFALVAATTVAACAKGGHPCINAGERKCECNGGHVVSLWYTLMSPSLTCHSMNAPTASRASCAGPSNIIAPNLKKAGFSASTESAPLEISNTYQILKHYSYAILS